MNFNALTQATVPDAIVPVGRWVRPRHQVSTDETGAVVVSN